MIVLLVHHKACLLILEFKMELRCSLYFNQLTFNIFSFAALAAWRDKKRMARAETQSAQREIKSFNPWRLCVKP